MKIFFWFLWFLMAETAVFFLHFLFRQKKEKKVLKFLSPILKILGGSVLTILVMGGPVALRPVQFLMTAFYVVLLGDAAADILFLFLDGKVKNGFRLKRILGLAFALLYFIIGTVNMQQVKPEYIEFSSEKLDRTHTFVFVSDIHTGGSQPLETTGKTIEEIRKAEPEFVVLGGDITDDYTTLQEAEYVYSRFRDFECPVYFVYGNHDRQKNAEYAYGRQYSEQELEDIMTANGIVILKDTYVKVSDDLVILGREDASEKEARKAADSLKNPDPDAYYIIFEHQPARQKEIEQRGADLQLSGHTHSGQFFPLRFVYGLIGMDAYGEYKYGDSILYVSPGASGWRIPFRTEGKSCFEVVTLKPVEK